MDAIEIFLIGFVILFGIPLAGMIFFVVIGILHTLTDYVSKAVDEWVGDAKYSDNSYRELIGLYGMNFLFGLILIAIIFCARTFGE